MAAIPVALALSIAVHAAPTVAPDTMVTFAQTESGLDPLVIHDNTAGRSYMPATRDEAVELATRLIGQRHSVDSGIMQINSANLERVGLRIEDAFDPWLSMRAGAQILVAAYVACGGERAETAPQRAAALRCASSMYNTGNQSAGISNGYTARIIRVATQVVPSVRELLTNFPGAAPDTPATVEARPSTTTIGASDASKASSSNGGWDVFGPSGGTQFVFTGNQGTNNAR